MLRTATTVCFTALFGLFFATASSAGQFDVGQAGQCQLAFSGTISAGDAQRLHDNLGAFDFEDGETSDQILCLNSPGGSLAEALKMGQILYDSGIGTRLPRDSTCLSACAVLFMLGTRYFYEGVGDGHNANRAMHLSARLGFHKPQISLNSDGTFDAAAVEKSFNIAIAATLEFVRLANKGSVTTTMIPSDLIEAMFAHEGADYFEIDTIGKTARWNIQVDGLALPRAMDGDAAYQACTNLGVWQSRYDPKPTRQSPNYPGAELVSVTPTGAVWAVRGHFEGDAPHFCLLKLESYSADAAPHIYACGMLGMENRIIGGRECFSVGDTPDLNYVYDFDARAVLDPAQPLAQANDAARQIEARAARYLASGQFDSTAPLRSRCAALQGGAFVTNVTEFANLRAAPAFAAPLVAEVPRDARVSRTDDAFYGADTATPHCMSLCQGAYGGPMDAAQMADLNQCFETNAIWYRVRSDSGVVGFLSGKFLRY
tara:strand:- start:40676 stop:42133 length:1458 start_codon:yes stop_codon:yes gene_type:complete